MFSTVYGLSSGMFVCQVTRLCVAPKEKNAVVRGGLWTLPAEMV